MLSVFDKNLQNLVLRLVFLTGLMISSPLMAPVHFVNGAWYDEANRQYFPALDSPLRLSQNQNGQWYNESGTLAQTSSSGQFQQQSSGGGFSALSAPQSQTMKLSYEGPSTAFPNIASSVGGSGGRLPSAGGGFSSSSSSLLLTQPIGASSSGTFPSGGGSSPLQSFQRPNYSSTLQSGGGLAQFAPASQNTFQPSSSFYRPQHQQQRPSPLTASSLASLSQQYNSPASPISAADFASIGDESESNVGDDGFGLGDGTQTQKPKFTSFPVQPWAQPGKPLVIPPGTVDSAKLVNTIQKTDQKSGFFGNLLNSQTNASVVKGIAAGDKTDAKYDNSQIDYQGSVLTADEKKSLVKDAKNVSKFLNAFFGQTTRTDETFRQLTGNLSSYVQKLKNNVRETQGNFVALFSNIDTTFGQSRYHDQLVALKDYTMNFFEQVINEYDRILDTADGSIQAVNEEIANFGQQFRALQAEVDKALSINASESVLMSVVDKLLSVNFFSRN